MILWTIYRFIRYSPCLFASVLFANVNASKLFPVYYKRCNVWVSWLLAHLIVYWHELQHRDRKFWTIIVDTTDFWPPGNCFSELAIFVKKTYALVFSGFLSTEDEIMPGNYGFKDLVAVLRWIQENVESFGGDKNRVTVAGGSSGGATTSLLLVSPLAKGYKNPWYLSRITWMPIVNLDNFGT